MAAAADEVWDIGPVRAAFGVAPGVGIIPEGDAEFAAGLGEVEEGVAAVAPAVGTTAEAVLQFRAPQPGEAEE